MNFTTEWEALAHLAMANDIDNDDLCPVVMDTCKPNCVCFRPARMIPHREDFGEERVFTVIGPTCEHTHMKCKLRRYLNV